MEKICNAFRYLEFPSSNDGKLCGFSLSLPLFHFYFIWFSVEFGWLWIRIADVNNFGMFRPANRRRRVSLCVQQITDCSPLFVATLYSRVQHTEIYIMGKMNKMLWLWLCTSFQCGLYLYMLISGGCERVVGWQQTWLWHRTFSLLLGSDVCYIIICNKCVCTVHIRTSTVSVCAMKAWASIAESDRGVKGNHWEWKQA